MNTMKTGLALWAVSVHTHAFYAKVGCSKKLGFSAAIKAVFAKALC